MPANGMEYRGSPPPILPPGGVEGRVEDRVGRVEDRVNAMQQCIHND